MRLAREQQLRSNKNKFVPVSSFRINGWKLGKYRTAIVLKKISCEFVIFGLSFDFKGN
jgi:hypothetical protein